MSCYPHHSLADGQLGLGTEVIRRSRKNDQRGRRIKWTHAPRRHVRERHRLDTVHGNGRSALPKRGKGTTDHDTWRARRRRWRYKRRKKRTQRAPPFLHYLGQIGRVDGYNIRVNLAIGPRWPVRGAVLDTQAMYRKQVRWQSLCGRYQPQH